MSSTLFSPIYHPDDDDDDGDYRNQQENSCENKWKWIPICFRATGYCHKNIKVTLTDNVRLDSGTASSN